MTLVQCAINDRDPEITLKLYADMAQVTVRFPSIETHQHPLSGSTRGKITTFSRKSRKRMIDKMTQKRDYNRPLFVTLTYPDEIWFGLGYDNHDLKRDLKAFRQRLERRFPGFGMVWRQEFEDRKSGAFIGHMAGHLHLIVDGIMDDVAELRALFRQWWQEIITRNGAIDLKKRLRVDVQTAKSRRHAMYYVSKYVAKEVTNQAEKLEDCNPCQPVDSGRNWGIAGQWDTSSSITVKLTYSEYIAWRRAVSRWLKSKGSRFARRMTRMSSWRGASVYGLGDASHTSYESVFDSAIFRLLMEVKKSSQQTDNKKAA